MDFPNPRLVTSAGLFIRTTGSKFFRTNSCSSSDCKSLFFFKSSTFMLPSAMACASISLSTKFRLWGILLEHETGQVALKILIKVAGRFCPSKWKERLGCAIFWRWMHCPNMSVGVEEIFLERIIKPRLGWWR